MTGVCGQDHNRRVDLDAFVRDGYVAVRGAVDAGTVTACQERIWAAMERRGIRRVDPSTWPPLVEGMDDLDGEPLVAPYGEAGTYSDADFWRPSTLCMTAAHATGKAGDVFLCHPFIVHTATWPHRGAGPRMIVQPAVNAPAGFALDGSDPSPVAQAIVKGLAMAD